MAQFQSYMICTSPRSGSTLLCRLLREAGHAGWPGSHFHEPFLNKWMDAYELKEDDFETRTAALEAVFAAAVNHGTGQSDVFGLRMQRHSFGFFMSQLDVLFPSLANDKARIQAAFGQTLFVYLTRENKLDQAISYVKATQSGLWHIAPDGTELERLSESQEPVYDATAISSVLESFERMETEWQTWFQNEGIEPLRVTYDDLSAAPYATLKAILRALGLQHDHIEEGVPPTARLADATNKEWGERFLQDAER